MLLYFLLLLLPFFWSHLRYYIVIHSETDLDCNKWGPVRDMNPGPPGFSDGCIIIKTCFYAFIFSSFIVTFLLESP